MRGIDYSSLDFYSSQDPCHVPCLHSSIKGGGPATSSTASAWTSTAARILAMNPACTPASKVVGQPPAALHQPGLLQQPGSSCQHQTCGHAKISGGQPMGIKARIHQIILQLDFATQLIQNFSLSNCTTLM